MMHPQAYGQMFMPQPMGQMGPQPMGQMGYPQMNADGSLAGIYQPGGPGYTTSGYAPPLQPGMLPPGFSEKPVDRKRLWDQFSYLDDVARLHGWVLAQLARVFQERNKALRVCIPTAAVAVFLGIIAVVMVFDVSSGDVDATLRQCKVLKIQAAEVRKDGATVPKYRPTVHVTVYGQGTDERILTRFRDAEVYEVKLEEADKYLEKYCIDCDVPCYEFDDGAFQLDENEYYSVWSYIIMAILLLSATICCCIWLASGTFACCSPLITVTVQA